ncbi:MAG: beta-ketoacyl-[acyl-carrier-protein] synthase family protein [Myxococcales bacterium]|nr:beta-ketoacyl-[acyl-carrier-protein] synthase family protein [Myxococcales bacterium]
MGLSKRVVISGTGAITPLGYGTQAFVEGLLNGQCSFQPARPDIHRHHPSSPLACIESALIPETADIDRSPQFAVTAAEMALADAGWGRPTCESSRTLLIVATTKANINAATTFFEDEHQPSSVLRRGLLSSIASELAHMLRWGGPVLTVSVACASGIVALGRALRAIHTKEIDRVLVVGVDDASSFVYGGFANFNALDPAGARPFDRHRQGLTVGEGAVAVTLEPKDSGIELAAYGASSDANHITGPARDGCGLVTALETALQRAQIYPQAVGFGILHGTGTPYNDAMEGEAYSQVFGPKAMPVASLKGSIGHLMGASGLCNVVAAIHGLTHKYCPPTVGLTEMDPTIPLDVVHNMPRTVDHSIAVTSASGFGGINGAIVLRRLPKPLLNPPPTIRGTQPSIPRVRLSLVHTIDMACSSAPRTPTAKSIRHRDQLCQTALRAADHVFNTTPGLLDDFRNQPHALVLGTAVGSLQSDHAYYRRENPHAEHLPSPRLFSYTLPNIALGEIAIRHQLRGEQHVISAGTVSGLTAIIEGIRLIESREVQIVLVLTIDTCIPPLQPRVRLPPYAAAYLLEAANSPRSNELGHIQGTLKPFTTARADDDERSFVGGKGITELNQLILARQKACIYRTCHQGYQVELSFMPNLALTEQQPHQ